MAIIVWLRRRSLLLLLLLLAAGEHEGEEHVAFVSALQVEQKARHARATRLKQLVAVEARHLVRPVRVRLSHVGAQSSLVLESKRRALAATAREPQASFVVRHVTAHAIHNRVEHVGHDAFNCATCVVVDIVQMRCRGQVSAGNVGLERAQLVRFARIDARGERTRGTLVHAPLETQAPPMLDAELDVDESTLIVLVLVLVVVVAVQHGHLELDRFYIVAAHLFILFLLGDFGWRMPLLLLRATHG